MDVGGCDQVSQIFYVENHSKIVMNLYQQLIMLSTASHYDVSVMSMPAMGLKKKLDGVKYI